MSTSEVRLSNLARAYLIWNWDLASSVLFSSSNVLTSSITLRLANRWSSCRWDSVTGQSNLKHHGTIVFQSIQA
jgi:hypothetical protein